MCYYLVFVIVVCLFIGGGRGVRIELSKTFSRSAGSIAQVFHTNLRNKGLISVDRRTSLLSHVQYPDPDQSRLQRILHSQCQVGD